jgi:HEAT repeat protein
MGSQYELRKIAQHDPDPNVRIAAIKKLKPMEDRYQLRQIANNDKDPQVRIAAVEALER